MKYENGIYVKGRGINTEIQDTQAAACRDTKETRIRFFIRNKYRRAYKKEAKSIETSVA